jgi:hypothetical protein
MGTTKQRFENSRQRFYDSATRETVLSLSEVTFADDFLGAGVVIPATAESGVPWVKKIVGAAPPTVGVKADEVNGILECALTATSEKQNAELYWGDELQWSVRQGLNFEARVKASVLPTDAAEIVVGFISNWADGLDAATYSVFFTLDGSGEIFCEKDDNATDESVTSGVTLTTSDWTILRINCEDYSAIEFTVDGVLVATDTTFDWAAVAGNSKVQPVVGVYKASGTGVGTLLVDYIRLWQTRS